MGVIKAAHLLGFHGQQLEKATGLSVPDLSGVSQDDLATAFLMIQSTNITASDLTHRLGKVNSSSMVEAVKVTTRKLLTEKIDVS